MSGSALGGVRPVGSIDRNALYGKSQSLAVSDELLKYFLSSHLRGVRLWCHDQDERVAWHIYYPTANVPPRSCLVN